MVRSSCCVVAGSRSGSHESRETASHLRILIRGTIILLLLDALLLGTVGVISRSPWLLGGAAIAASLTYVVVRLGKAYEQRRAEMAASRAELKGEARMLADAVRPSRDS